MPKTKITPRVKHPEHTEEFIKAIQEALDAFEEHIHFPDKDVRCGAYRKLLEVYRTALTPTWNLVRFADIDIILEAVCNKEMRQLSVMAKRLQPSPATTRVTKEDKSIPDAEAIVVALRDRHPSAELPDRNTCAKIGEVFNNIHAAHKAYAKAAEGLAELATEVTPQQYTMLITAAVMPAIQITVPGELLSPLTEPQPLHLESSTALGKADIIKNTKLRVLPNSTAFSHCDKNSATWVLAATVYCKLEHLFFDETLPCINIATEFRCNISQLTKAITGVDYKGGSAQLQV